MNKKFIEDFKYIISYVSPQIQNCLCKLNEDVILRIQEIRIRQSRPVVIVTDTGSQFLTSNGKISSIYSLNCVIPTEYDISQTFNKMCDYSIHSHYEDILNGYITLSIGARVGITGTAVFDKNKVKGIRDIDGINIRMPRNIHNISTVLISNIFKNDKYNLLIAGPPSSGKTTVIKDLTFQLSSGINGYFYKICVIDERKEIASSTKDLNIIGSNTDVLSGFPKSIGISMAVRTLSPEIIICDEVSENEIETVINAMNCGVSFVFTVHAKDFKELKSKKIYKHLVDNACVDYIAFLKNSFTPGQIDFIVKIDEDSDEIIYNSNSNCNKLFCDNKLYKAM